MGKEEPWTSCSSQGRRGPGLSAEGFVTLVGHVDLWGEKNGTCDIVRDKPWLGLCECVCAQAHTCHHIHVAIRGSYRSSSGLLGGYYISLLSHLSSPILSLEQLMGGI